MKKPIFVLLLFVLIFSLTACNNSNNSVSELDTSSPISSDKTQCNICGQKYTKESSFCANCGAVLKNTVVPFLQGLTLDTAIEEINNSQLKYKLSYLHAQSDKEENTIVAQDVQPQSTVPINTVITITIADNLRDFEYKFNSDGSITLTGMKGAQRMDDVYFPKTFENYTVTKIDLKGFEDYWILSQYKWLIPSNVEVVNGDNVLANGEKFIIERYE